MRVSVEYEVTYKVTEEIELDEKQLFEQFPNSEFLKDYWVDCADYDSLKNRIIEVEKSNLMYDEDKKFVKINYIDLLFDDRLVDIEY